MRVLKNAKHEKFAQGLAKGLCAVEAYQQAGYAPHRSSASKLQTNPNICKRVKEIQERIAEKAEWTAADRLIMLQEIALASKAEDPRVAVSAIGEANKMQGSHAPTKSEHTGADGGPIETVTKIERTIVRPNASDPDS